jgi:hypothetical protein
MEGEGRGGEGREGKGREGKGRDGAREEGKKTLMQAFHLFFGSDYTTVCAPFVCYRLFTIIF